MECSTAIMNTRSGNELYMRCMWCVKKEGPVMEEDIGDLDR